MAISEYREYGWKDGAPLEYHQSLIKHMLKFLPIDGTPILDIGCGNGALDNELIAMGYNVYGIDASKKGVDIANIRNLGRFYVMDVVNGKLPDILSDIPFRTVISTEVIEHLYYPRGLIDLAKLALKIGGGGRLIISTPYHGYLKNLLVALFNRMDYHFSALWNGGHIKFWSFKTISVLLRERGFENIEFKGIGHMYLLWKQMIVKADISKFDD